MLWTIFTFTSSQIVVLTPNDSWIIVFHTYEQLLLCIHITYGFKLNFNLTFELLLDAILHYFHWLSQHTTIKVFLSLNKPISRFVCCQVSFQKKKKKSFLKSAIRAEVKSTAKMSFLACSIINTSLTDLVSTHGD